MSIENIAEDAGKIADKYLPDIRFTYTEFYDSETSPFPAVVHLDIPTRMLREYASLREAETILERPLLREELLKKFWIDSGLAEKLMAHKDVRKIPEHSHELPIDMLEYLVGENICVELSKNPTKRNIQDERVEIEVYDVPYSYDEE